MIVAPSLLAADFTIMGQEIERLNVSNADWLHVDVMDGVFVPNISLGFELVKAIVPIARKPLDVHLMIVEPDKFIPLMKSFGVYMLTVHYEACPHLHRTVQRIREKGMRAGVALNPHTPVELLEDILPDLDLVLIMSVNPGFGGQKFIPSALDKVQRLRQMICRKGLSTLIEVDGGVCAETALLLRQAGADVLVAGNYVFTSPDPLQVIQQLKTL